MNFGQHIKNLRLEASLTQTQLAAKIGITKSVLSYYELHDHFPPAAVLIKLATIFHVSTDHLLGITPGKKPDVSSLTASKDSAAAHINNLFSQIQQPYCKLQQFPLRGVLCKL